MDKVDFKVRTSPEQAGQKLLNWIEKASISGSLIDQHVSRNDDFTLIVLIFEKYFMRNSSRASLTVTLDNLEGPTRVQATGSGGGQGALFRFDWGAGKKFANQVQEALAQDMI